MIICPKDTQNLLIMNVNCSNGWKKNLLYVSLRKSINRTKRKLPTLRRGVEEKVCYFRVVSARKTTVRLLNVPRKTVSDAICRCKELGNDGRRPGSGQHWEQFLFIDETLFTVQQVHNSPNDRIWCVEAPSTSAIVEHRQYPKSVMVWGGICLSGKTPLVFVEEGVKINQKVYQRDIIEAVVLPLDQKTFRKCKLDASTRLCISFQDQKDTRVVQGEFSRNDTTL
ncbi:uncharacterized protein TNCV_2167531 [Trichonephila clavipes]|nr:uncharacterized protein TNCV_2167531 [Trichonephila clavipes]